MKGKKILFIEDEPDILKTTTIFLQAEGFEVVSATDGMEGLEKARTQNPDLIIMDIMLPKLDGYKLCRMLKFDERYKDIPVIFFTARAQDQDEQISKEVCADAFIKKPVEPKVLIDKVKELLKERS
ncbi:MAG: response regulator [Candidatus Omnitrophica bacterium]|nr:response regulator [Candidatus Omnitrophota bacterium]MCM8771281.1 response regulator [Candidatus Omnitrophota bacterium]